MSRVDELLSRYAAAFEEGRSPDAQEYLEAAGEHRGQLEAALERYLRDAPRRGWDSEAFAGSPAAKVAAGLDRSLGGTAGLWPSLLPRLRARAQLRRADLVGRLASSLGAQGQAEKVGAYYHEMEQGRLPSDGVSDRVLEALGSIVGESAGRLREAGAQGAGPTGPAAPAAAFARTAAGAPEASLAEAGAPEDPAEPWDEVDRLFRGGPS